MIQDEEQLLKNLDRLILQPRTRAHIEQLAGELARQLQCKPAAPFVRQELPLSLYGAGLAPEILSSNVYVIRPGVTSGKERHPNSHQRSMSLAGGGAFVIGLGEATQTHSIAALDRAGAEVRWVSIPPNTWHEAVAGEAAWTVVSFHTVADRDIVNERNPEGAP